MYSFLIFLDRFNCPVSIAPPLAKYSIYILKNFCQILLIRVYFFLANLFYLELIKGHFRNDLIILLGDQEVEIVYEFKYGGNLLIRKI